MGLFSKRPAPLKPAAQAPRVAEGYYTDMLTEAGFPRDQDNVEALCRLIAEMFLGKALQLISSRSQAQSEKFKGAHRLSGPATPEFNQQILDDLVAWDREVAPYISDLPDRVRRILLEADEGTIFASPKDSSLQEYMSKRDGWFSDTLGK